MGFDEFWGFLGGQSTYFDMDSEDIVSSPTPAQQPNFSN
jgi:hypothetical protein